MRRIFFALALALGLSPGLLWRVPPPRPNFSQALTLTPLPLPQGEAARVGPGGPLVTGAWRMDSPNSGFGSYSELLATGGNSLLAISDRGQFLRFPMPGTGGGKVAMGRVLPGTNDYKPMQDMESATRDPATGRIWVGLEGRNAIIRFDANLAGPVVVQPPQMHKWTVNGGPESMVRLTDGRFVVLAETQVDWGDTSNPGLVFPGDPLSGKPALAFRFVPPAGYYPSDMAQLPDGRLLIVLRGVQFLPPRFTVRLAIADPAEIRAGALWRLQPVGEFTPPLPIDNYEGLAITGGEGGRPVTMWLVSDDNTARLFQRSLLLRLEWQVPPRR